MSALDKLQFTRTTDSDSESDEEFEDIGLPVGDYEDEQYEPRTSQERCCTRSLFVSSNNLQNDESTTANENENNMSTDEGEELPELNLNINISNFNINYVKVIIQMILIWGDGGDCRIVLMMNKLCYQNNNLK